MKVSAPGKVMLAGEWAILEDGFPCVVAAVNVRSEVNIEEAEKILLQTDLIGKDFFEINYNFGRASVENDGSQKLTFALKAIEFSLSYLESIGLKPKGFALEIVTTDFRSAVGEKIGFGSSASITVALVGAILSFFGVDCLNESGREKVFKIATLAHYFAQEEKGSAFDIAASVYGGVVFYRKYFRDALMQRLGTEGIATSIDSNWPGLLIEKIEFPNNVRLLIGFTGKSSSSKELMQKVERYKMEHSRDYEEIMDDIKMEVLNIREALVNDNFDKLKAGVKENRNLLKKLGEKANVNLETKELTNLIEAVDKFDCAGKFSGAGGGDIGIGFCQNIKNEIVKREWEKSDILPLEVQISESGLVIESL